MRQGGVTAVKHTVQIDEQVTDAIEREAHAVNFSLRNGFAPTLILSLDLFFLLFDHGMNDIRRIGAAQLIPGGGAKCLYQARQRRCKERAPDAEELGSCDQGDERRRRMDSHRASHDTWTDHITLYHVHDDEVPQHDQRQYPALEERDQDADRS